MTDSKRIYGILKLMLSKTEELENASLKKREKERKDLLRLQKMLSEELI